MKQKRAIALIMSVLIGAMPYMRSYSVNALNDDVFFEDFDSLDESKWLIAQKNWGGTVTENGETKDYNGGVIPENAAVKDGKLILTGMGNGYNGAVLGINRDKTRRKDGKRCGGAIATKDYFASGSYEIRAKISPEIGACSAMWTFEYEEDHQDGGLKVTNHEIDIEFPGRNTENVQSLDYVLCTNWTGENENEYTSRSVYCGDQTDGEYHTYRFDWHTGGENETPRVEYYFDGKLTYTSYEHIPANAGRFWLGLWFPKNWAGVPDFDVTAFIVDYVKITPFHESGDKPQNESYPDDGWGEKFEASAGDTDLDGQAVTLNDISALSGYLTKKSRLICHQYTASDINGDEKVNVIDLLMMKRRI